MAWSGPLCGNIRLLWLHMLQASGDLPPSFCSFCFYETCMDIWKIPVTFITEQCNESKGLDKSWPPRVTDGSVPFSFQVIWPLLVWGVNMGPDLSWWGALGIFFLYRRLQSHSMVFFFFMAAYSAPLFYIIDHCCNVPFKRTFKGKRGCSGSYQYLYDFQHRDRVYQLTGVVQRTWLEKLGAQGISESSD